MGRKRKWIQNVVGTYGSRKRQKKRGVLHRQLGIPYSKKHPSKNPKIPIKLLTKIKNAPIGKTIKNPTKTGKRRIRVTRLLKRRSVLAHNLRRF